MLVAEGLRKRYKAREVVRDFALTLDAGEVVGLLGPNGAGKTTCFYMIVGLVPADAGRIVLDGHDITGEPMYARAKRGVGYLPQEPSVFRRLSVADNLRLVLELRSDLDRDGRERELSALLEELQVSHVAEQIGASLSGGERRRVEIARALAAKPRLILLDEPFAGVDPISVGEIQRIVRHLKNRGIGVLITDHNVRETLGICDRAYILNEGKVLAQGAPAALLANQDVRRVYLGESFRRPRRPLPPPARTGRDGDHEKFARSPRKDRAKGLHGAARGSNIGA
jgi:lipopolysaccharide export system ATP-binding protein